MSGSEMTNSFHSLSGKRGIVTLMMTVVLVILMTLIIIFTANNGILQSKMSSAMNRNLQAFNAADAGAEYAINYFKQNRTTILASPSNGYISYTNASLTNVSMDNGSSFSVTYTNPVQNNYSLIQISSTGTSNDGSSTHTVTELMYSGSLMSNTPSVPLLSISTLTLGGNTTVTNTYSSTTVQSGSSVTINGSGKTVLSSGISSTSSQIQSDIQQNVSSLSGLSSSDFFETYFGMPASSVSGLVAHYYSSTSNTNYSSTLNGMNGTSIWIDQASGTSTTLNGNISIGSAANPVLLVINGNLTLSGTVTIYGMVFVTGTATTSVLGNVSIIGSLLTSNTLTMSGTTNLTYDPTILSNLTTQDSVSYQAKVPGSWKDF